MNLTLRKIAVAILLVVSVSALAGELAEYQIKAEFIERFTRFVEWPASASQPAASPFVIGIIGRDPFGGYLDAIARERTIKGRPVRIHRLKGIEDAGSCQILFIAASESARVGTIVATTRTRPVLTIGDSPGYLDAGVMINLYTEDNKVRFEINEQELARAGFQASAQLLKLARASAPRGH
ncbi:MAG: YfiR family protein [Thermoanaerobaculia bacterium]